MSIAIPDLHISSDSRVSGKAVVEIARRRSTGYTGLFQVKVDIHFDPATTDYPSGVLEIGVDLNDSIQGLVKATSVEQITSFGKSTPTVFITGRCQVPSNRKRPVEGCRYWVMIADNKHEAERQTPDVVGFVVFDRTGKRIAYGTGPVSQGDIEVAAS